MHICLSLFLSQKISVSWLCWEVTVRCGSEERDWSNVLLKWAVLNPERLLSGWAPSSGVIRWKPGEGRGGGIEAV